MDTHLTNISVFAEIMGVDGKTLHKWYKEILSGFNPEGKQIIHSHDVTVRTGRGLTVLEVPIVCTANIEEHMGIDEKKIGEDFYTIMSNRKTGKIAFCASTTKYSDLQQAMRPLLPYMEKVRTITRDMAGSYAKLCTELIPKATQIADKFHVISNLMEAQQSVRIRYRQKALEERRKELQLYKEQEKLRMEECEREGKNFTPKKFYYHEPTFSNGDTVRELLARSHFLLYKFSNQWSVKQAIRAKILFENYPEIQKVYVLACQFRKWYARENIGKHLIQIEKELFQWYEDVDDANIEEMMNFKSLVESHEEVIINYFQNGDTNAMAENLNGRINKLITNNYGVRNIDFFFFRMKKFFT